MDAEEKIQQPETQPPVDDEKQQRETVVEEPIKDEILLKKFQDECLALTPVQRLARMRAINYMGDDYYYLNDLDRAKLDAATVYEREDEL